MSAFAMFSLTSPSLLAFDKERVEGNVATIYGMERVPCDTHMREILDPAFPEWLRPLFTSVAMVSMAHRRVEAIQANVAWRCRTGTRGGESAARFSHAGGFANALHTLSAEQQGHHVSGDPDTGGRGILRQGRWRWTGRVGRSMGGSPRATQVEWLGGSRERWSRRKIILGSQPVTTMEWGLSTNAETLSTSPHKRGVEIMPLWPLDCHIWPSPSRQIW